MLKYQPGREYRPHTMARGKGATGKLGKLYIRESRKQMPVKREVITTFLLCKLIGTSRRENTVLSTSHWLLSYSFSLAM